MTRCRLLLSLSMIVCFAVCANGQDSHQSFAAAQEGAVRGVIEAVVLDVQGTSLTIAGGVVIDISRATILSVDSRPLDISIRPGMCIRAGISGSDDARSALIAAVVRVQPEDLVVFSGPLQEVDLENDFVKILNQRVNISRASYSSRFVERKMRPGVPTYIVVRATESGFMATHIHFKFVLPIIFP